MFQNFSLANSSSTPAKGDYYKKPLGVNPPLLDAKTVFQVLKRNWEQSG